MGNQYTKKEYSINEIELIISKYKSGIAFTKIAGELGRQKNNIKKLLIEHNVWVNGKNNIKKIFSEIEIKEIEKLYTIGLSCETIALKFNVSKTPIRQLLKINGLLRIGNSNGKKIFLTNEQIEKIKNLYLNKYKSLEEISLETGLTSSFINKYLSTTDYRRNKSKAMSISKKGVKLSEISKTNMRKAQQKLVKSGNRKQTGGICKNFIVNGLICQGTFEKYYIDKLITDGITLPKKANSIITPYGVYYPDFTFDNRFIEIKSDYTYEILLGNKINRFTKKIDTNQYEKIKWVNKNIKTVEILIIDKRNNIIIKKEIE